jgi:hypothetical protein
MAEGPYGKAGTVELQTHLTIGGTAQVNNT